MYFKGPKSAKENWTECESILLAYPSVHAALHITECEPFPSIQCAICYVSHVCIVAVVGHVFHNQLPQNTSSYRVVLTAAFAHCQSLSSHVPRLFMLLLSKEGKNKVQNTNTTGFVPCLV